MTEFLCRFVRWLNETRALHHFVAVLAMIDGGVWPPAAYPQGWKKVDGDA